MKKLPTIIDIFVTIVDNYGDMGFACELVNALSYEYNSEFECILWTDDVATMMNFMEKSHIYSIQIADIGDFGKLRKSAIALSLLHGPIPSLDFFEIRALILRIDYLSLDPVWISNNEKQHISSTTDRQIIELIPSPLAGGAGLIPPLSLSSGMQWSETECNGGIQIPKQELFPRSSTGRTQSSQGQKSQKHIIIFVYPSTLQHIDWDSFPMDLTLYVFGALVTKRSNIICLDWLPIPEFYALLDTSQFTIIRGEVSWAHSIQTGVPFFWDMYQDIGGFPADQSEQFLSIIDAPIEYREIHQILNGQKSGKIKYADLILALSHTRFIPIRTPNLIHTVKKHIDRFNNSI